MISIQQLVYILLYFQSIDIDKERICLEKSCDVEIDDLPNQVPSDKPRYHFFIFKHTYEGDYLESIGKYNENFFNDEYYEFDTICSFCACTLVFEYIFTKFLFQAMWLEFRFRKSQSNGEEGDVLKCALVKRKGYLG